MLGVVMLVLLLGANQAAARGTGENAFAVQDNEFCDAAGAAGTPIAATPEGFTVAAGTPVDVVDVVAEGTPKGEVAIEIVAGTPVVGTPAADVVDALGDDLLDVNDEGALCQDVDGDGINEIGIDQDKNGSLDENEVLGSDLNDDEALTEDELDT